jgi:heat shock protein HslJ
MITTALAAGVLALAACSQSEGGARSASGSAASFSLAGTSWIVTELGGEAPVAGRGAPSIAFDGEGRVSGTTGCNRYSGGFVAGQGGALTLGGEGAGLATTRMACTPELNAQETRMLALLSEVARFALEPERLTLSDAAGEALIVAAPAAAERAAP